MSITVDNAHSNAYLLRKVEIDGSRVVDVRVSQGRVAEIGASLDPAGAEVVHGAGHALIPGLVDHHIHLLAMAARQRSLPCGPPSVADAASLRAALRSAKAGPDGWIRGTGYIESVAGDLDRWALDAMLPESPVRIQHRSGALWMLNSAAARAAGLDRAAIPEVERDDQGQATGRVWRADAWLRSVLPPAPPPDLAPVGRLLTAHGITAVADATPDLRQDTIGLIAAAMRDGGIEQDVLLLGAPSPLPLDERQPRLGPVKLVIADSALPGIDELRERIRDVHDSGRPVAVHCVSRQALFLLVSALTDAGVRAGDRVEHASVVPGEAIPLLRGLGVRVVTQPGFIADRGDDYLGDVEPYDLPGLYRVASLIAAGIPVAFSSDAPYGPLSPWEVIAAAVTRQTGSRQIVNAAEALGPRDALDRYLSPLNDPGGAPRRVRPGAAADLVLLDAPLNEVLGDLTESARRPPVRAVFIRGKLVLG